MVGTRRLTAPLCPPYGSIQAIVMPAEAGIQYAAAARSITNVSECWIARLRGR